MNVTLAVFRGNPSSIPAWGVGVKGPLSADGWWAAGSTPNGSHDLLQVRGGRSGAGARSFPSTEVAVGVCSLTPA